MTSTSNVIPLHQPNSIRRARGQYVKQLMEDDGRSARYMAGNIGISNTAFSDRLKGKAPFLADELELIARVLKLDPIAFYRDYITAVETSEDDTKDYRAVVSSLAAARAKRKPAA